jgi:hypothetical protein
MPPVKENRLDGSMPKPAKDGSRVEDAPAASTALAAGERETAFWAEERATNDKPRITRDIGNNKTLTRA